MHYFYLFTYKNKVKNYCRLNYEFNCHYVEKTIKDLSGEISSKAVSKDAAEKDYFRETLKEFSDKEFTVRTDKKVRKENKVLIDSEYNFIMANIDRKVIRLK